MNVYEVKFVHNKDGVSFGMKQKVAANDADEALASVVQKHNDFFGVDYDPELDPTTLVVVTKLEEI